MGPELLYEYRYSSMLNTIFVTLMYGTGLPILYFFAFLSLGITYWVDKWALLRVYQTPPRYDITLQKTTREWTNIAVLLHLIIGLWMFSNSILFNTEDQEFFGVSARDGSKHFNEGTSWINLDDRLGQWHTFIYFVVFVFLIIFFILKTFILGSCIRC